MQYSGKHCIIKQKDVCILNKPRVFYYCGF